MNGLTLVVEGPPDTHPQQRSMGQLPQGEAGTEATIAAMVAQIRDAAEHPLVRDMAQRIAEANPTAPAAGVYMLLRRSVRFHTDPPGLELLRHPARMIAAARAARTADALPIGDCDDRADLGASILLAMGLRPVLTVMARTQRGPWEHVYAGAINDAGVVYPIDADDHVTGPGREAAALRRRTFSVL